MANLKIGEKVTFKRGSGSTYELIYIEDSKAAPVLDPMCCFVKFGRYNVFNLDQQIITIPKSLIDTFFLKRL